MYACDFEYDGKYLSDFGFVVCSLDGEADAQAAEIGSQIEFEVVPVNSGKLNRFNGSKYSECLTTTFQICKDPKFFEDTKMMRISREEFQMLSRWLNRRGFYKFRPFDFYEAGFAHPHFYATFNLSKVDIGKETYGIELTATTNSPFGYAPERWQRFKFDGSNSITFRDPSDEIGYIYPRMKITCLESGALELSNEFTGSNTVIKNCSNGEVIYFSGDSFIITSSEINHDLMDDFNFDFFCFGNDESSRENVITASLQCNVEIGYEAIIKDTISGSGYSDMMYDSTYDFIGRDVGDGTISYGDLIQEVRDRQNYATKDEIRKLFKSKGTVNSYGDLPTDRRLVKIGDVYNVEDDGMDYVWTGEEWDSLGSIIEPLSEEEINSVFLI